MESAGAVFKAEGITMLEKQVRASAVFWAALWILAVAVAIVPFAASAQFQPSAPASAKMGVGTAPAPKLVDLSALPQVSARALAAPAARQPLRPQNGLSDQQYAAHKTAAAGRRFEMPYVQPLSPRPGSTETVRPGECGSRGCIPTPAAIGIR